MAVPMMDVRIVRVRMCHGGVSMRMRGRLRLGQGWVTGLMFMFVMDVVDVRVTVLACVVDVLVLMALTEVQPTARAQLRFTARAHRLNLARRCSARQR